MSAWNPLPSCQACESERHAAEPEGAEGDVGEDDLGGGAACVGVQAAARLAVQSPGLHAGHGAAAGQVGVRDLVVLSEPGLTAQPIAVNAVMAEPAGTSPPATRVP